MPSWDDFLHWAGRVAGSTDLTADEREYKVAMAARIRDACELSLRSETEWQELLGRALSSENLLSWRFVAAVKETVQDRPEQAREAIRALWQAEDPAAEIDQFAHAMESAGVTGQPGGLVSLASVLLMGRDPAQFPPYRTEFVRTWATSVGVHGLGDAPSQRYGLLLELCDDLLRRAPEEGLDVPDRLDAQGLAWATMQYEPPVRWSPLDQAKLTALRAGEDPGGAVVERGAGNAPDVEAAVWLLLEPGLRGQASPFDPTLTTWRAEVAADLLERLMADPLGGGTFWERFEAQLADADDATVVLAAELMCLRLLPLSSVTSDTKVTQVRTILSWAEQSRPLPSSMEAGLRAQGAFGGGMGYNQRAAKHLQWMCRFIQYWSNTSGADRSQALRDPFALMTITAAVSDDVPTMRYTLEYLIWPGIFPPVASVSHRKGIHQHLMSDLGDPSGSDDASRTKDLVALWAFHECADPSKPDWYEEPFVSRWLPGAVAAPRAWLVRAGEGGSPLVQQWVDVGFVSLKAHMLGELPAGTPEKGVATAVKTGYMHLDATQREATTRAYHWFLSVMKPDDLVATLDQGMLRIGMVTGEPEYVDSKTSKLRREVAWNARSVSSSDIPVQIASRLEQQGTVVDLTSAYDELAAMVDVATGEEPDVATLVTAQSEVRSDDPRRDEAPSLPAVSEGLAEKLYMPRASLQEMVDLLQARQQMVFYGPPGTGKTYVAKTLAHHLVGDPSHYRLVQFHPSYSYEDFFEGYRPTLTEAGQPTFVLRPGPLKQMVSECQAAENRGEPFILIVDEMNRANLAKVFGELYFLLEYRDETVQLQYQEPGSEPFFLPRNLFIVGTMNTTDRSIALVDAAIRRRFPFYELHPGEEPVSGVLGQYLVEKGLPDTRSRLLNALNETMGESGRDLHIGPSYFMRSSAEDEVGLERIWRYDILPLLEEHFYGQMDRDVLHERFGLSAIRRRAEAGPKGGTSDALLTSADEPVSDVGGGEGTLE